MVPAQNANTAPARVCKYGRDSIGHPLSLAIGALIPVTSYNKNNRLPPHPEVITKGKCYTMPFYEGLRPNGWLIINAESPLLSEEDARSIADLNVRVLYVPASRIALDVAGTELATNMALLGGLAGATDIVTLEGLEKAISQRFGGGKFIASATTAALDDVLKKKYAKTQELLEKNMAAIRKTYELVKDSSSADSTPS
ncbi:2-oxoacid:acceptor oxidoreductase family protein [Dehalococcoidia bacterium]|nr:2-oxoacid:acceptor oxidoreductase family protein [Dehalococcoidia bacterium]